MYDTGAARSCMNYDKFFNLGLDLYDKPAPHVRTALGIDMRTVSFTMLTFAINGHVFTQQFIVISGWFTKSVWFVGCTGCTLQTLYAWLVRSLHVCMVGILIYRVLHLSLGCDSWLTTILLI